MADKLNRGQGLSPNTGLNQNSIKLGGLGLTAKDNSGAPPVGGDALLLETGDFLLLETGDKILLEA